MPTTKQAYELGRNAVDNDFYHHGNPEKDAHFTSFAQGTTEAQRAQLARAWVIGYGRQASIEGQLDELYDR